MGSLLDIIASAMVGGMLLLIALSSTDRAMQTFHNFNADAIVQQNLARTSNVAEFDLRKMGFGIPEANQGDIIQKAKADNICFLAQLNLDVDSKMVVSGVSTYDQTADTVEYQVVVTDSMVFADTTVIIYSLQRTIKIAGLATDQMVIGRIGNNDVFTYLDQAGKVTANLLAIKMIEVNLTAFNLNVVLSPELVASYMNSLEDGEFKKDELKRILRPSFWKQTRLVSKNLKR